MDIVGGLGRVHEEAAGWVAEEIERMRAMSYEKLRRHEGHALHREMLGTSGEVFVRETEVFWDGDKGGDLRVEVEVSQPDRRGFFGAGTLAIDDFIEAPGGSVVDE